MTRTIIDAPQRDYYCNKKFWHLKIDLESRTTYNCHAAQAHRIDLGWLKQNPSQLFNTDINVKERQMMLENQRNPSCEQNCWYAEDRGQASPRTKHNGEHRSHHKPYGSPEVIDLTIGSDCNLTCSYCCKEYSQAWRRDIDKNGAYELSLGNGSRYQLLEFDRVLMKVSQSELMESQSYSLLLDEVRALAPGLKKLTLTGGEPFLNNRVIELLADLKLDPNATIDIYTGLGVNESRFARMLDRLQANRQVTLSVSAENIGRHLEFNRYGIKWQQFQHNLKAIHDRGISVRLHSTISNLTAFGFMDFYRYYQGHDMGITFAFQPHWQALHVLDADSKQQLAIEVQDLPEPHRQRFISSMDPDPTQQEQQDMSLFLQQFVKRRPDLSFDIYPASFLSWLGINHVV